MGPGIKDPRNEDKVVTCLSCHDPHGTPHAKFLRLPQRRALCIQCHKKFR
jgi:predicted CXXCH cytochrome family protein